MIIKNLKINKNTTTFLINNKEIYLKYSIEYEKYISSNYDGPLILALPIAMRNNEKLIIKGKVSYKLFHNVKHYLMKIINIMLPECKPINIEVDDFSYSKEYNNVGVGCGLSCGIDSLCCLQDYYFDTEDNPYKLTHVTNFDAGASGNSSTVFNKRVSNAELYCQETTLNMLKVETNFTSINNFGHQKIHVIRNLSIPLFFQKLFCKYYYSSTYSYIDSKIKSNSYDIAYGDPIVIPLLSTENIEFISHGCQYTRPEKTLKISENSLSYKYLDVCINGSFVNNSNTFLNCSTCWKCLRTLTTLDYYKKLYYYEKVFNLEKYYKIKDKFLRNLNKNSPLENEIIELYKNNTIEKKYTYNKSNNNTDLSASTYHHVFFDIMKKDNNWKQIDTCANYSNYNGMSNISNSIEKYSFLDSKHLMANFFNKNNLNFIPKTFVINTKKDFNNLELQKGKKYLVKPPGFTTKTFQDKIAEPGNSGNGIYIVNEKKEIKYNNKIILIQEMIENLYLINDRVFHLRNFFLIINTQNGLTFYNSKDSFIRLAVNKYNGYNNADVKNIITNYSGNILQDTEDIYCKLLSELNECKIINMKISNCLDKICKKLPEYKSKKLEFMLLGVDFMFDKNLNPYLLEFNYNPLFCHKIGKKVIDNITYPCAESIIKNIFEPILSNKPIINTGIWNKIDNLNENKWLALKSHWKLSGNKLTSTSETFLKKNELHSSKLDDKLKIKIPLNKEVLYIKEFNNNYYLVSHPL